MTQREQLDMSGILFTQSNREDLNLRYKFGSLASGGQGKKRINLSLRIGLKIVMNNNNTYKVHD